ncbi:MAG TPA: thiolase family protein [Steroidobacteraceae bacterium]|jgi:acetyl-CoA C-acetyltransferase|nr:thiolase family protein [Steroidobacteraceae bacterium]
MSAKPDSRALLARWPDAWLLGGVRTPFVDFTQAASLVSPIDLGIKAAREAFSRVGVMPSDTGTVIAGCMAQASFDAYVLPRHIGLYSGVPVEVPAHLVQRVCGTGIEVISQGADAVAQERADLALCVGTESMSRNPVAAYTHRTGFRMGQVEFRDFLWEALLDPSVDMTMGGTAESLAKRFDISRAAADRFASRSFDRALAAQADGFFAGEICPLQDESFDVDGFRARGIRLRGNGSGISADTHVRGSSLEQLAKLKPAFGGVQTGGNSSAIVDGAAAVLVGSSRYVKERRLEPLARLVGSAAIGVHPESMGLGPVGAIRALLRDARLELADIDRIEINEAFAAQVLACVRELGLDESRLNVNGGAIALGHPLGATGIRLALTLARELRRQRLRYGIASACIGGGQGIALLIENVPAGARA